MSEQRAAEIRAELARRQQAQQQPQQPQTQVQLQQRLGAAEQQRAQEIRAELARREQEFTPQLGLMEPGAPGQAPVDVTQEQFTPEQKETELERIKKLPEADLGAMTRLKFSVEPLQSNRRALLVQRFGEGNVLESPDGDFFVLQNGQPRPVNTQGISAADLMEIAGTAPETLGTIAGGAIGAGTGLGTAGTTSIPGAAAGGALGGALAAGARQGVSALLGTPQVAGVGERAADVALSATVSGVAGGAGVAGRKFAKKLLPTVTEEGAKLVRIAKTQKIPAPTIGQKLGGLAAAEEEVLSKTPLFGGAIRKRTNAQVEAIQSNLKKQVGDFFTLDSQREKVGSKVKDLVSNNIKAIKAKSSELYDQIAKEGKKFHVDSEQLARRFVNSVEIPLFDQNFKPLKHNAKMAIDKEGFLKLQRVLGDVLKDVIESPSVSVFELNNIRKTINKEIKRFQVGMDFTDVNLIKAREAFEDVTQEVLGKVNKPLGRKLKEARSLWSQQMRFNDIAKKLKLGKIKDIDQLSDEKIVNEIFKDKKNIKLFKKLVDKTTFKETGNQFVFDTLKAKTGTAKNVRAETVLSNIRKNKEIFREAIGDKKLNDIIENLEFLKNIGDTINPSGTGFFNLIKDPIGSLGKGLALQTKRQTRKALVKAGKKADILITVPTQVKGRTETRGAGFKKPKRIKKP